MTCAIPSFAQQSQHRIQGPFDRDIPIPSRSHNPDGYRDASALGEINAYANAIGIVGWAGMQASGTLTFASDQNPLQAALFILPENLVKLDVTTSGGHEVTKFSGTLGVTERADGSKISIAPTSAAVGIAPFELPITAATLTTSDSIIDDGIDTSQGQPLRRLSIEIPILTGHRLSTDSDSHAVVDAYFDPKTKLLIKTASMVAIPGNSRQLLLRVITYSNYQSFNQMLIPTTMAETINGQAIWTLKLSDVDLIHPPTADAFLF